MDYLVLLLSVLINTTGLVVFKTAMIRLAQQPEKSAIIYIIWNPLTILALLIMLCGAIVMGVALKRMDLSIAMPLSTSLAFVLIGLVSWLIFKENIGATKLVGFALLILGSILIAR